MYTRCVPPGQRTWDYIVASVVLRDAAAAAARGRVRVCVAGQSAYDVVRWRRREGAGFWREEVLVAGRHPRERQRRRGRDSDHQRGRAARGAGRLSADRRGGAQRGRRFPPLRTPSGEHPSTARSIRRAAAGSRPCQAHDHIQPECGFRLPSWQRELLNYRRIRRNLVAHLGWGKAGSSI